MQLNNSSAVAEYVYPAEAFRRSRECMISQFTNRISSKSTIAAEWAHQTGNTYCAPRMFARIIGSDVCYYFRKCGRVKGWEARELCAPSTNQIREVLPVVTSASSIFRHCYDAFLLHV